MTTQKTFWYPLKVFGDEWLVGRKDREGWKTGKKEISGGKQRTGEKWREN